MTEIDLQADLNAVNDQITKMVEELNRLNAARDQMIQQVQNMNGVAMYLRGKMPPEARPEQVVEEIAEEEPTKRKAKGSEAGDDITRKVEYP